MVQNRAGSIAIGPEFAEVRLGDARLDHRLRHIADLASTSPSDSFPEQMKSIADREGLYRFLGNQKVTMRGLLSGHHKQTHERIGAAPVIRVVHDTSVFHFRGEREGLGIVARGMQGFFAHVALAVGADDLNEPLGVLGVRTHIHEETVERRRMTATQRAMASRHKRREDRESSRWEKLAVEVSRALPGTVRAIHVMDQEADDYAVFAALHRAGLAFVIRANPNRKTTDDGLRAKRVLAKRVGRVFRSVHLSPRSYVKGVTSRGRHPARTERMAKLRIRWAPITLRPHTSHNSGLRELTVNAVHVFEPKPPAGEKPIEWMLITSEPVTRLEDAAAVVDHYRARWTVEEYFKSLKTGCSLEKRQLTSFGALQRTLALFVPIAWRLLAIRHLGRRAASTSAQTLFVDDELAVLSALLAKRRYDLPRSPTIRDAMLGIATLGGHIRSNGDPGWLVLGRGFTSLTDAVAVWRIFQEEM